MIKINKEQNKKDNKKYQYVIVKTQLTHSYDYYDTKRDLIAVYNNYEEAYNKVKELINILKIKFKVTNSNLELNKPSDNRIQTVKMYDETNITIFIDLYTTVLAS